MKIDVAQSVSISVALVFSSFVASSVIAGPVPAEFPPTTYKGSQYVDSTGCAFIRAGNGPVVNWVQRIDRQRKQICGLQPTRVSRQLAPRSSAPNPLAGLKSASEQFATQKAPLKTVASAAVGATALRASQMQPRTAQRQLPRLTLSQACAQMRARGVVYSNAQTGRPIQCPTVSTTISPQPSTLSRPVVAPQIPASSLNSKTYSPCQGGVAATSKVRCGPQTLSPVTPHSSVRPVGSQALTTQKTVSSNVLQSDELFSNAPTQATRLQRPKGYEPVWTDGRLNPLRGNAASVAAHQVAASQVVTRNAATPVRSKLTNRSARGQYVQIGSYRDLANVRKNLSKMQARGLPAQSVAAKRNVKAVVVGPFAQRADVQRALNAVRSMGYSDAFIR